MEGDICDTLLFMVFVMSKMNEREREMPVIMLLAVQPVSSVVVSLGQQPNAHPTAYQLPPAQQDRGRK